MINNSKVYIKTSYITLGNMLKFTGIIHSGGEAKFFLQSHNIKINDIAVNNRGFKIQVGDNVKVDSDKYIILADYE
jgi:ribosome-associated protein YbcJ (S4-like RNA binding protein)